MLEEVSSAHARSAVWALAALPSGAGFLSAGGDGSLKAWDYSLVDDDDKGVSMVATVSSLGLDLELFDYFLLLKNLAHFFIVDFIRFFPGSIQSFP